MVSRTVLFSSTPRAAVRIGVMLWLLPGVKTRYHVSFFVISKGELCLIPVVPGVFHSNNRFHAGIDVFRGKSADSDEVVPYFILFKFQLFFIGERLKLGSRPHWRWKGQGG